MKKLLPIIILTRPLNCLITFLSIWVGAIVAGESIITYRIVVASLSGAFIAAYGNIINDLFDIEVDKLNKPFRPLAKGTVSRSDAIFGAIAFAIVGLALSYFVHKIAFVLTLMAIAGLLAYTPIFKGKSYLGNILVALISALAFVIGGLAVDKPFGAAFLVLFAFLLHLGREIVKDIQDRSADIASGYHTGAACNNGSLSRILASILLTILIIATFVPNIMHIYGYGYLIVVIIGVDLILIESIHRLIKSSDELSMRRISAWLKLAMPFGLFAVLLGRLGL
jgi:geranylgeranylglycerol-phosphate geranylgeranyltransferase